MASTAAHVVEDPGAYGPEGRSMWLDVDWAAHQRWVPVAGRPVNVCEIGPADGAPVVWIHGLAGCWQNLPVLAAQGYRCVALDLPGFGHSPMPAEKIAISAYAQIADALLGELGIDTACVVGNSMGGFVAAELAICFPARVERLVLVSAAGISIEDDQIGDRLPSLRHLEFAVTAYGGWLASRSETVARRATAPGDLPGGRRPPRAAARAAGRGEPAGLRHPGLPGRARGADDLPDRRAPARDRLPSAGRLG